MSPNPLTDWRIVLFAPARSELGNALYSRLGIEAYIQADRRVGTRRLSRSRGATGPERRMIGERRGRYPYHFTGALVRPAGGRECV